MIRRRDDLFTTKTIFDEFILEKRAKGVTNRYLIDLEYSLNMFLDDVDLSWSDDIKCITKSKVIEWTNFLRKKNISVESINNYLRNLRTFINWCIKNESLYYFQVQMVKGQSEKMKFYNEEELSILTKRPSKDCSYTEERTWVIICLILSTGIRASTVVNIKKEDIADGKLFLRHTKNKQSQYLPLNHNILTILNNYTKTWDIDNEYLFTDLHNNTLTTSALRTSINSYCTKRQVTPRGVHALRHSFAREWIKNGGNAMQLQYMLGHKTLEMSKRYCRLFSDDIDIEAYSPLDNFLKTDKRVKRVQNI